MFGKVIDVKKINKLNLNVDNTEAVKITSQMLFSVAGNTKSL